MNERLVAAAVLWSRLRFTGQLSHGNCTEGQKGASVPLGRGGFRRRRRADRANSNLQVAITDQRLELKFALAPFRKRRKRNEPGACGEPMPRVIRWKEQHPSGLSIVVVRNLAKVQVSVRFR